MKSLSYMILAFMLQNFPGSAESSILSACRLLMEDLGILKTAPLSSGSLPDFIEHSRESLALSSSKDVLRKFEWTRLPHVGWNAKVYIGEIELSYRLRFGAEKQQIQSAFIAGGPSRTKALDVVFFAVIASEVQGRPIFPVLVADNNGCSVTHRNLNDDFLHFLSGLFLALKSSNEKGVQHQVAMPVSKTIKDWADQLDSYERQYIQHLIQRVEN